MDKSRAACYWFEPESGSFRGSSGLSRLLGVNERLDDWDRFLEFVVEEDRAILAGSPERDYSSSNACTTTYRLRPTNAPVVLVNERRRYQDNGMSPRSIIASLATVAHTQPTKYLPDEHGSRDSLTGLLSRRNVLNVLADEIEKRPSCGFALMFLDIDRFRFVNDSMGHTAGDIVLEELAKRLNAFSGDHAVAARSGSDEFLVVIFDVHSEFELQDDIEAIGKIFSEQFTILGSSYFLSLSGGIALYPRDGENVEDLLQSVDAALYNVKQSGGGAFEFTTPLARQEMIDSCTLELELQQAIRNSELVIYYQPLWSFRTNCIIGSEALLRWNHPERGLLLPGDFLPQAEGNGTLIRILGNWVFDQVCAQIRNWRMLGINGKVWINVAPMQVHHRDFEADICSSLFRHNVSPAKIGIELTERTLLANRDDAICALRNLKDMGLSIALDDFGVEYSSLSYVHHLPIDTLKIDQMFVSEVETDRYDKSIIHTIVSIASELGLSVTAEGVEMPGQYQALKEMGCHSFQGWLYSPALQPDAFVDLVRERGRVTRTGS